MNIQYLCIFVAVTAYLNRYLDGLSMSSFVGDCLLVDSRRLMYFLNNTQFSGASGPVQFAGADRTGIIRINQFVGNTSDVVGQFSADMHRNASDRMTLDGTIHWMTDGGLPPSDGTPGTFLSQCILIIRCFVICGCYLALLHCITLKLCIKLFKWSQ